MESELGRCRTIVEALHNRSTTKNWAECRLHRLEPDATAPLALENFIYDANDLVFVQEAYIHSYRSSKKRQAKKEGIIGMDET
jgi:hypothetical protein